MVGEIGRDRREYLYEMPYWEILLIQRGYRRRNILQYQLQRLQAYCSFFAMGGNKDHKEPHEWLPMYFDRYKDRNNSRVISDEEYDEIQAEMAAINAKIAKESAGY